MTETAVAKIISRETVFDGYHKVEVVTCQPKSLSHEGYAAPMEREVMYCGKIACALLYVPETDALLLNQQFRVGAFISGEENPFLYECAAGAVDDGETPEEAARREAFEETGATVLDIEFICRAHSSAGCLAEEFYFYLARIAPPATGVFGVEEEGEEIKTHLLPVSRVIEMMDRGEITNGTTLLALHWFVRNHDRLKKKWSIAA